MELIIDSSNIEQIKELNDLLTITGVTTNPTILTKSGREAMDVVKDLCDRAVWIYKGELKLDGDPIYVIDEYLKQVKLDHKEEAKKKKNDNR